MAAGALVSEMGRSYETWVWYGFMVAVGGGAAFIFWSSTFHGCQRAAKMEASQLERLEKEIDFRRASLLTALEKARTKADIDNVEVLLTTSAPFQFPEMKGQALSDLTETYDRLRQNVTIGERARGADTEPSVQVDPWLLDAYPVDQVGFLYGTSPEQLDTLRLAARQELSRFRSASIFRTANGRSTLDPDCSALGLLSYAISGGTRVRLAAMP